MSFFGRNRAPPRSKRSPTPTGNLAPTRKDSMGSEPPSPGGNGAPKPYYLSRPFVDAALVKGNFRTIVMQPKYVDVNEWVAVNMYDFYTNLNEFYGVLTECCTQQSCPTMSAGPTLNYTWVQDRKKVALSAPTYIDSVMSSIQNLLDDENLFPTKSSQTFDKDTFPGTIKQVYQQLLRVFAHLYHAHYPQILHLRSEPHFNSMFAHFLAFGTQYHLFEERDIRGEPGAPVGVGLLWERWRSTGILEG
ncbi:Mob1/phocein [Mycena rebaudengoi]|nr:Mob1/phocein [Mycena rebaudengoi]